MKKILLLIMDCILISYNAGISLTKGRIVGRMSTKVSRRNPLLDFWRERRCCMNKQVLSILVENTAGVLSRVSGLSAAGDIVLTVYPPELLRILIIPG